MHIIFSSVCRIADTNVLDWVATQSPDIGSGSAILPVPEDVLDPRQVIVDAGVNFTGTLREHRGQYVLTVTPAEARRLVTEQKARFAEQSVLVYSREAYLADEDVKADEKELARVSGSDAEAVLVAVIGAARSPLAVCRNIVSGCVKGDRIVSDAEKALGVSNYILIEE